MNWDDLRFVLAVARAGSLAAAARRLGVDHTTVGRRVEAAEGALGVTLFARNPTGFALTPEGERLLEPLRVVEDGVLALSRLASARETRLEGQVRVTSPETFGISWLAPRLATFARQHPQLTIELLPGGTVLDLGRREAELAIRFFRSAPKELVVRKVARLTHALYGSVEYLHARPFTGDLAPHRLLAPPRGDRSTEARWLRKLAPDVAPAFTSEFTLSLLAAVKVHAGLAVLPRYLGDAEPGLRRLPLPDEPHDDVWLTVHRDLKDTPRVRALLDFLASTLGDELPLG